MRPFQWKVTAVMAKLDLKTMSQIRESFWFYQDIAKRSTETTEIDPNCVRIPNNYRDLWFLCPFECQNQKEIPKSASVQSEWKRNKHIWKKS